MLPVSPFAASQTHTTEKITETAAPCLAALLCPVFTKTGIFLRLEQCRLVSAPAAGQAALFALLPGVGGPFHAADVDPHQSPATILGLLWEKCKTIYFLYFLNSLFMLEIIQPYWCTAENYPLWWRLFDCWYWSPKRLHVRPQNSWIGSLHLILW